MNRRERLTRRGVAAALVLAALAICADSASAATKDFSVTIAPSSVLAGRLVALNATLTNLTSQQQLGSANITPPQNYTAVSVTSLSLPAPASATIVSGVVQLRQLSLPPQQSVTVSLTVDTPCSSGTASQWTDVIAKQANDFSGLPGNDLTLRTAASSLTTTTIGTCTPCPEDTSCTANLGGPAGSQSSVTANSSATQTDAGRLTISIAGGLDCADYVERSSDIFQMDAPANRPKFGLIRYASSTRPITSKDPLEVCYASPTPFAIKPKTLSTTAIIDGVPNTVGRLPNCLGLTPPPCVTNRDDTLRTIEFSMPTGDPRYM
jgi:hypothetical protein